MRPAWVMPPEESAETVSFDARVPFENHGRADVAGLLVQLGVHLRRQRVTFGSVDGVPRWCR